MANVTEIIAGVELLGALDPDDLDSVAALVAAKVETRQRALDAGLTPEDLRMAQLTSDPGATLRDVALFKAREASAKALVASLSRERISILHQLHGDIPVVELARIERAERAFLKTPAGQATLAMLGGRR